MEESDKLLLEIARCKELSGAKYDRVNSCHTLVNSFPDFLFRCPEPWSGDINSAELLIVSSNPNYDPEEKYPSFDSDDIEILEFFKNRNYSMENPYWWTMFTYAGHILRCGRAEAIKRVATIPIVHCSSKGEEGLSFAAPKCSKMYLSRILSFYKGKKIIVSGISAKYLFKEMYPRGIRGKIIVYAPHMLSNTIPLEEMISRFDRAFKTSNTGKWVDISK